MTDRERFRHTFSHLHASADTVTEVLDMYNNAAKRARRFGRRAAVAVLAAVLAMALGITGLAAAGVFPLRHRTAAKDEQFHLDWVEGQDIYWKDAKLVFNFDGPDTARAIRFRPGYLPVQPVMPQADGEGWYTRLTTEMSMEGVSQPCQIEVYYAPKYVNGGNLILLYDEPGELVEETWGAYQTAKFETVRHVPDGNGGTRDLNGAYVLLYHPGEGYLVAVSGQSELSVLERVARELEVEPTEEVISAADYEGYNTFIDWGVG